MHVLIFPSEEYLPSYNPIAGIFQHDQAKILKKNGYKVSVISYTAKHSIFSLLKALIGKKNKFTNQLTFILILKLLCLSIFSFKKFSFTFENIDGINISRIDCFWRFKRKITSEKLYKLYHKNLFEAFELHVKNFGKPDIIHAHNMIYAGLLAYNISKKFNIPFIVTEHSSQYAMGKIDSFLTKKIKKVFLQKIPLYAVSTSLSKDLVKKFPELKNNIQLLENVLDPDIENLPLKNKNHLAFRFLNIGNLIQLKGQTELIEAFNDAFHLEDNVELHIIGEGPLKRNLLNKINELHLSNKIKLLGLLSRKEIVKAIDNADVLVMPSHYETFGVSLIEALSRGKPVISTYCGGPESIITPYNGLIVPIKDRIKLKEALIELKNNYKNYDGNFIRNKCIDNYGSNTFLVKISKIYNNHISIF
ncbi:MAG: glycosyltransferase [Vicingaceae bacterium]